MNQLKTEPFSPDRCGVLRFSGPDTRAFLQGQLTHDLALLAPDRPLLAAHCNPQGRVVALVTLIADGEDVIALLPASMTQPLHDRLRKYLLRAKVKITDASADIATLSFPAPHSTLEDIAAGRPQIYPATSELFVAQMLNLDLIDGISFSKGCYTGQEVIARAHYRGKVKRRMQHFRTLKPVTLIPGESGLLADGRSFTVVIAAQLDNGCSEFLAVAPLTTNDGEASEASVPTLETESLSLSYVLPF